MPNLKKGGQVTIFVILGVILLILFLGAIFYFSTGGFKQITTVQVSFSEDVQSFKTMRDSCLQKKFFEAKDLFGVQKDELTQLKYEAYLKDQFPECMKSEINALPGRGIRVLVSDFSSTVKISPDAISVDAIYPVTLSKGDQIERLSAFSYNWKIERAKTISLGAGGRAGADIIITSTDQKIELKIPKDTVVTTSNDQPVSSIDVDVIDRFFNNMANPVVVGSTVYDFPDMQFSPHAILTVKYETSDLLPNADETQQKVAYYDTDLKEWVAWPSTVDTAKKTVSAEITHLSDHSDIYCSNANNLPQKYPHLSDTDVDNTCRRDPPPVWHRDLQINFQDQNGVACNINNKDNLRVTWSCFGECQNVQIKADSKSAVSLGSSRNADIPASVQFAAGSNNHLTFDVVYVPYADCCISGSRANNDCVEGQKYKATYDFDLTLFYGQGFFPSCIDNNEDKEFDVTQSCVCGYTTIDLSSAVYNGQDVKCCANTDVECSGTCTLANCEIGQNLTRQDTGCQCGTYTHQPLLQKDWNYCCEAGKDCSLASCKAIIGGKAVETCYCKDDSAICGTGMTCNQEHCCPTGKCWDKDTKKCAACGVVAANCSDGKQNQGEEGVDCGGPCPNSCGLPAHCSNNQKDADETGLDCGGADCDPCVPAHCKNTVKDGDETDVNCGGADCAKCINGKTCTDNSDCVSDYCKEGICTARQFDKPNIIDIVIEK